QEVSVALVTKNAPLGDEAHTKHWLIRTTLNKCRDFHKSYYRRNTEPLDQHLDIEAPERNEILEEIFKLPKNYSTIIYLYYYEGYSIAEIAEILGKNPNTVSSSLQRARKRLKNLLEEGGFNYA
ncbi:MAG: sigma-70 family RNA polymerase sigma factor, partial [Ruminococcus sp.]|nr:sigma-70 family RNA polymerase sigma factor [Ruminococcus sp.]